MSGRRGASFTGVTLQRTEAGKVPKGAALVGTVSVTDYEVRWSPSDGAAALESVVVGIPRIYSALLPCLCCVCRGPCDAL